MVCATVARMDAHDERGTPIAPPPGVARRAGAMAGIVILIALALALIWRVYLHRERTDDRPDEPELVRKNYEHAPVKS